MENNLPVLSVDYSLFFHIINFIILYFFVKKFFFKKIENVLEMRTEKISDELHFIQLQKEETLKLKDQMEIKLDDTYKESQKLINDTLEKANVLKNDLLKEGKEIKEEIIKSGKDNLKVMESKLKNELRAYTISLALKITEKVLEEKMNDNISEDYYMKVIDSLEEKL